MTCTGIFRKSKFDVSPCNSCYPGSSYALRCIYTYTFFWTWCL